MFLAVTSPDCIPLQEVATPFRVPSGRTQTLMPWGVPSCGNPRFRRCKHDRTVKYRNSVCKFTTVQTVRYKPVYKSVLGKQRDRSFAADVTVEPRLVRVYRHHRARPRRRQSHRRVRRTVRRTARCRLRGARVAKRGFFLHIVNTNSEVFRPSTYHPPYIFQDECPSCRPTNSIKALKATSAF